MLHSALGKNAPTREGKKEEKMGIIAKRFQIRARAEYSKIYRHVYYISKLRSVALLVMGDW